MWEGGRVGGSEGGRVGGREGVAMAGLTLPVNSGASAASCSLSSVNSLVPRLTNSRRCVFTSELKRPTAVWEGAEQDTEHVEGKNNI